MKPFTFLPHTADIGLEASGRTLPALFENAARGMFAFLAPEGARGETFSGSVEATGMDAESLLVNWLSELLYLARKDNAVLEAVRVTKWSPRRLSAEARWRRLPPGARLQREIKAVTYHGLKVRQGPAGFEAAIIFDV